MSKHHKIVNWRRLAALRRQVLAEQPICAACHQRLSAEMDHITPVHVDPTLVLDRDNVQGLCVECHKDKTRADLGHKERVEIGIDGFPR